MKTRHIAILTVCLLLIAPLSAGAADKGPEFVRLGGGGMGGAWYLGAAKIGSFVHKIWPDASATATPGGGVLNLRRIAKKEYEIVFSFTSAVYPAAKGQDPFKKPIDLRFIASTNPAYVQCVAGPKIKSFKDLDGKKLNGGLAGHSGNAMAHALVKAYGIDTKVISASYDKMPDMQVDGVVDATLVYGSIPHLVPNEILTRRTVRFLSIDEEIRDKFVEKNPGYVKLTIEPNSFKKQDYPVQTLGSMTCIVCSPDFPEEWVYKLVKYIWEHRSELIDAHSVYKQFTEETVPLGRTVPWHPGAEKFWKEIGVIK